jgi:hypothetical protein
VNRVRLLLKRHLAGDQRERNAASAPRTERSFVAGLTVRRSSERAGLGACAASWSQFRDEHPGTPGRDRVTGLFNDRLSETWCRPTKKAAQVSKSSVGSRRMERLIREEIIGHRMRAGLGAGRGRIVCAGSGRALALFHQPAREHRAGVFVKPLIEQRSNFPTKVSGMTEPGEFVGLERCSRSGQQEFPRRLCFVTGHGRSCGDRNTTLTIR